MSSESVSRVRALDHSRELRVPDASLHHTHALVSALAETSNAGDALRCVADLLARCADRAGADSDLAEP